MRNLSRETFRATPLSCRNLVYSMEWPLSAQRWGISNPARSVNVLNERNAFTKAYIVAAGDPSQGRRPIRSKACDQGLTTFRAKLFARIFSRDSSQLSKPRVLCGMATIGSAVENIESSRSCPCPEHAKCLCLGIYRCCHRSQPGPAPTQSKSCDQGLTTFRAKPFARIFSRETFRATRNPPQ